MVKQLRDAWEHSINLNPSRVGFISGTSVVYETVRFPHEQASVPTNKTTPVGLGTSFSLYAQMFDNTAIVENTLLIFDGKGYKVGPVDEIKAMGEVIGKRSPLTIVTPGTANLITSFKIGTVAGVINNTANTITITLPTGTVVTSLTPVVAMTGKIIDKTGAQNFTTPVEYTITAENLTTKKYTVTVVL